MSWAEFRKGFIFFQPKEERQRRYRDFRLAISLLWEEWRQRAFRTGGIE